MEKEIKAIIKKELESGISYPVDITISNLKFTYEASVKKVVGKLSAPTIKTQTQPAEKRKYRKRKFRRTGQFSLHRDYTTSPEDVKVMRTFLGQWDRDKILSPDYKIALSNTRHKFSTSLSWQEKENIKQMFLNTRQRVLSKNGK